MQRGMMFMLLVKLLSCINLPVGSSGRAPGAAELCRSAIAVIQSILTLDLNRCLTRACRLPSRFNLSEWWECELMR